MFRKICVLGCGLIGSSLLRAIDKKKLAKEICAYDKSKEVSLYLKKIFSFKVAESIDEAVKDSDLVIISAPLSSYKEIKHVNKWNYKLYKEFKKLNINTNKSFTNFLLINYDKMKKNSNKIFNFLAKAGILVRKMNSYGIKNSLRVTIGKSKDNKKFILKLKKVINV